MFPPWGWVRMTEGRLVAALHEVAAVDCLDVAALAVAAGLLGDVVRAVDGKRFRDCARLRLGLVNGDDGAGGRLVDDEKHGFSLRGGWMTDPKRTARARPAARSSLRPFGSFPRGRWSRAEPHAFACRAVATSSESTRAA